MFFLKAQPESDSEKLLPKLTVSEGAKGIYQYTVLETHTEVQRFLKEGNVELACELGRKPSVAKKENITPGRCGARLLGKHKAGQVHLGENQELCRCDS